MKNIDTSHPFYSAKPVRGLVNFNFRRDAVNDLHSYAEGYHSAAKALAKRMRRSVRPRHFDGLPVLFLYRHALELYLKAVIHRGNQFIAAQGGNAVKYDDLLKQHRLGELLPPFKAVIEGLDWLNGFSARGVRGFQACQKLICQIDRVDPESYSFRYPTDTKGRKTLPKNFCMNALGFAKSLDPFLSLLDTVMFALDTDLEHRGYA